MGQYLPKPDFLWNNPYQNQQEESQPYPRQNEEQQPKQKQQQQDNEEEKKEELEVLQQIQEKEVEIEQELKPKLLVQQLKNKKCCHEKIEYTCGVYSPETHILFQCEQCSLSNYQKFCQKKFQVLCGSKPENSLRIYRCKKCFKIEKFKQLSICGSYIKDKFYLGKKRFLQDNDNSKWCGLSDSTTKSNVVQCEQCYRYDYPLRQNKKKKRKSFCNIKMIKRCFSKESQPRYFYKSNYNNRICNVNFQNITIYCGMVNSLGYQHQCSKCYVKDLKKKQPKQKKQKKQKEEKEEEEIQKNLKNTSRRSRRRKKMENNKNLKEQQGFNEECNICLDKKIEYVFENCGHAVVCKKCLPLFRHSLCPLCRKEIQNKIKKIPIH